jgi:hypothetical protein
MLRHYFALALRNTARTKLYAAISVIGLAIGFGAATLIGLYVHDELSYERFIPSYERIYQSRDAQEQESPLYLGIRRRRRGRARRPVRLAVLGGVARAEPDAAGAPAVPRQVSRRDPALQRRSVVRRESARRIPQRREPLLVLEIGSARLLLPGDAEVGAWLTILANPTALELAASATFVKIGHHGSHNATPLMFVRQHLAEKTPAVISTQQGPGKYRNGIPLVELLTEMGLRHMPFVRSDQPPGATQGIFTPEKNGLWIDCTIPC